MASVKKNFAYQSVYQVVAIVLPLLTSPYISRVLGAEKIGIYSYTYAVAYYFLIVAQLGIKNYGNKEIAAARDDRDRLNTVFSELLIVHGFFSTLSVAAYYAYVLLFVTEDKTCALLQGFWVISGMFDVSWLYFGLEKFRMTVTRSTVVKIAMTACIFLFVKERQDLWIYITIMAFGTFLSQLVLWPFLNKYITLKRVTVKGMRRHIWPMFVLFLPTIAVSFYKYMDKIMLGLISDKVQVGFYENAERAINIPVSVIASFGTVMLPRMSNLVSRGDTEKGKQYILTSMKWVMCLSLAMAFGMAAVADNFSVVFWGDEFEACGQLIVMLCITIPFLSFADIIRMQYLIPGGKNHIYVLSVTVGAIVNVVINSLFIPRMGAEGAAVGTIFAEISVCVVQAAAVRKNLPVFLYLRNMVYFLLTGILMFAAVYKMEQSMTYGVIHLLLQILTGVVIYGICALIYFTVTGDETLRNMAGRFRK